MKTAIPESIMLALGLLRDMRALYRTTRELYTDGHVNADTVMAAGDAVQLALQQVWAENSKVNPSVELSPEALKGLIDSTK